MKKIAFILLILVLALVVFYFWPVPSKNITELADKVEPQTLKSLLKFREHVPLNSVTVEGREWRYAILGSGEETILFLHGMTGAYDIWWQQMVALSDRFRVISLTYPPVATLKGMTKGLLAILDAEKIPRTHVVGSSLGGYLVQYLLAKHPQRIQKAIMANTFPPNDRIRQKNGALIRTLPYMPNWLVMRFFRKSFVEKIYPAAQYSELVLAYLLEQATGRMSKAQVVTRAQLILEPFSPADPDSLSIPVMIIEADNDPLVEPALREQLKATYPSAQVQTLHNVGHFPYLNDPVTYTSILAEFFEGGGEK